MADDLILQKLSNRFRLLGSLPHLRICHCLALETESGLSVEELADKLGLKKTAVDRLLIPLVREDLVHSDGAGRYRAARPVLRDLSDFVNPSRSGGAPEYPRPACCWPHSA